MRGGSARELSRSKHYLSVGSVFLIMRGPLDDGAGLVKRKVSGSCFFFFFVEVVVVGALRCR